LSAPRAGSPAADLFAMLQMRGVACGYAELDGRFRVSPRGPGRHWFYYAKTGTFWIDAMGAGLEPIRLAPGDALAIANDAPHEIRASEDRRSGVADALLVREGPRDAFRPAEATHVLFVASVARADAPLSELFPTVFRVAADGSRSSRRLADLVRLAEDEIAGERDDAGSSAVLDRIGDLILIELLRVETRRAREASPVWVHGIADPAVARLVTRFHAEPGSHWTWESMGRAAGLSRSALDRHFRTALGESPKRYLFALRMRLAAAALAEGRKSIGEIATAVGYESEPAFHRAFRRTLGLTPGAYGRHPAGRRSASPTSRSAEQRSRSGSR
jgi:AraC-like DNA-binding protein